MNGFSEHSYQTVYNNKGSNPLNFAPFSGGLNETAKKEGFTEPSDLSNNFIAYPVTKSSIDKNYNTINALYTGFNTSQDELLQNYKDLSNNVSAYLSERKFLQKNNDKYHYDDTQDPNVIIRPEESKDIKAAINNDITEMKLYQNSIYITTAIACATLLIGTIMIGKK